MQAYDLMSSAPGRAASVALFKRQNPAKKLLVIEKRASIGGVCTNTGTIPSKTMRESGAAPLRLLLSEFFMARIITSKTW